ncbi:MAG TPA: hypothetical protein VKO18_04205 [Terriglobia bacterium]|nr:hypothetical protein [Terriglobia bacterium]
MRESFENALENAPYNEGKGSIFRAMKAEADGLPKLGRSGRELGVRIDGPSRDLVVGDDGTVAPGNGGMSVALDAALNLPKPRLPKSLGGEGRDPVFSTVRADIPPTLLLRPDRYPHALVEPGRRCALAVFESDLASTRSLWSKAHD